MGLFSSLSKNKQEPASDNGEFYSRAETDSSAGRKSRRSARGKGDDAAADPMLPEKKRARRRLIGALALVLAAVIGLPMILDSEPQPVADDIQIQIPSKDKPGIQPAPMVPPPAAVKEEAVPAESPATTPEQKPAAEAPSPNTAPVGKEASADKPVATAPAAKAGAAPAPSISEVKPAEVKPSQAKPAAAAKSDDGSRALAILEGKHGDDASSSKGVSDKATGKYAVQVAALASKAKINELQAKLKHAGVPSYTQTVATQSGERTRVRAGPFASKEEAEKIRAKLLKSGLNGTIVPLK